MKDESSVKVALCQQQRVNTIKLQSKTGVSYLIQQNTGREREREARVVAERSRYRAIVRRKISNIPSVT